MIWALRLTFVRSFFLSFFIQINYIWAYLLRGDAFPGLLTSDFLFGSVGLQCTKWTVDYFVSNFRFFYFLFIFITILKNIYGSIKFCKTIPMSSFQMVVVLQLLFQTEVGP